MLKTLRQIARIGNVSQNPPTPAADSPAALHAAIWQILGRALCLRLVDAASCNACELELSALGNPYYNLEGHGIRFVASPRHADVLLVTGPIGTNMVAAVKRTWDAMPDPKRLVAVGDCAACGGVFGRSYAALGALSEVLPVDLTIPGCPPSPTAVLRGLLAVAARNVAG
ncbi:MAG: formate hydrogenlyase [Proteobacteria bacterium]|nr:formate hydrogenlyase [Pseudomonadota bacterium]MBS0464322.1 formate hydrogenlyase [Pseudomonadota bacterium]